MTMLDRMRRHKGWLKWSLGFVVLTFIVLYIPSFLSPTTGAAPGDAIATVNGRKVPVLTYQRAYAQQVDQMRRAYGEINEQMLRQLGIGQRTVDRLVNEEAVLAEAERLGITVTDGELRERLMRLPGLQEGGQFIGHTRYRQMLDMQRPPMREAEFEAEFRRQLLAEKLQNAVTGWVHVSDADVLKEFNTRNEKVKLDLAIFTANQFRAGITPTDAEIAAQFASNTETYRLPEKRRVRYLSIDADALRAKMTATPAEVEARYRENIKTYETPEQVRASHILLKTEGKDEAAVRKVAESLLAKIKGGADFAALAKQFSEDEQSKARDGDLDYFGKGAMVKEFDEAVWALQPGQLSGIVKTQFGLHIIKLVDKKAAITRPLVDVRVQIEEQIKSERARAEAEKIATEIAPQIDDPSDLDTVAKARGLTVADSGLFAREEPMAGLGFAPAVTAQAFTLEKGKVSGMLQSGQGYVFIALTDIQAAALPTLEQVKDKVRDDVIRLKAVDVARQKAATMAQAAKANFAAAAKAAGVEVKATELVARGATLPEIGVSAKVDDAVFKLKAGETSEPIATDTAVVVARVKERTDASPDAFATEKDSLRTQLRQQRGGEFFTAYMMRAREKMTVTYNERVLATLISGK